MTKGYTFCVNWALFAVCCSKNGSKENVLYEDNLKKNAKWCKRRKY